LFYAEIETIKGIFVKFPEIKLATRILSNGSNSDHDDHPNTKLPQGSPPQHSFLRFSRETLVSSNGWGIPVGPGSVAVG
jgi:hypothetical protein